MKIFRRAATAAVLASVLLALPAHAQFGSIVPVRYVLRPGNRHATSITAYPIAMFAVTGDTEGLDKKERFGGLVAADVGFQNNPDSAETTGLGGWFFADGSTDVYEVHAKYFRNERLGVQVGALGSTRGGGSAVDAFVLYNISADEATRQARRTVDMQIGAGVYYDNSHKANFTGFVQASLPLRDQWSLEASYWAILKNKLGERTDGTTAYVDLHRLAIGASYRF